MPAPDRHKIRALISAGLSRRAALLLAAMTSDGGGGGGGGKWWESDPPVIRPADNPITGNFSRETAYNITGEGVYHYNWAGSTETNPGPGCWFRLRNPFYPTGVQGEGHSVDLIFSLDTATSEGDPYDANPDMFDSRLELHQRVGTLNGPNGEVPTEFRYAADDNAQHSWRNPAKSYSSILHVFAPATTQFGDVPMVDLYVWVGSYDYDPLRANVGRLRVRVQPAAAADALVHAPGSANYHLDGQVLAWNVTEGRWRATEWRAAEPTNQPTNLVTTDTQQEITAQKAFTGIVRFTGAAVDMESQGVQIAATNPWFGTGPTMEARLELVPRYRTTGQFANAVGQTAVPLTARIDENGSNARLEIAHPLHALGGVVMRAPSGALFRLQVGNDGALTTTPL